MIFTVATGMSPLAFIASFLPLAAVSAVLAELVARAGLVAWIPAIHRKPGETFGLGFLTGVVVLGTSLFGLGCAGLLYLPLVGAAVAAPAVLSLRRRRSSLVVGAARAAAVALGPWALVPLAFGLLIALNLTAPWMVVDSLVYHLGAPWQFLLAHRILGEGVPTDFLFPFPVEMNYMVPFALGDARLASWLNLVALAAAAAVFLDRGTGRAARAAGLVLAGVAAPAVLGGKPDPAVAAFFAAGAILTSAGSWRTGALMLGCAAGAKYTCAPLVACWLLFVRPPARSRPAVAVLLLLPVVPWLVRAWLFTGDPVFPFGWRVFHTPFWQAGNENTFLAYATTLWKPHSVSYRTLVPGWIADTAESALPVLVFLPGVFMLPGRRREVLGCVTGQLAVILLTHTPRFNAPSVAYLCLLAPSAAAGIAPTLGRWCVLLPVLWAAGRAGNSPDLNFTVWKGAVRSPGAPAATLEDASRILGRMGVTRVIGAWEWCSWPIRVRLLSSGYKGETPYIWKSVRESFDPAGVARRFRQSGAQAVLQNTVTSDWHAMRYAQVFRWDDRMLRLYRVFALAWLEPAAQTDRCDFTTGCYQIYRVRTRPAPGGRAWLPGLPGAETAAEDARRLRVAGDDAGAAKAYGELARRIPGILAYHVEYAYELYVLGSWEAAWREFQPAIVAGMVHPQMSVCGLAALRAGRPDEARLLLRDAEWRYPHNAVPVRFGLAEACVALARREAGRHRTAEAGRLASEAVEALDFRAVLTAAQESDRVRRLAEARALRARLAGP